MSSPNLLLYIYIHTKKKATLFQSFHPPSQNSLQICQAVKEKGFRGQNRAPEPSQGSRPTPHLRQRHPSQLPLQGGAQRTLSNVDGRGGSWHWMVYESAYNEYTTVYIYVILHSTSASTTYLWLFIYILFISSVLCCLLEEGFDSKCEVPHSEAIASMMLLRADKHYSVKGKWIRAS